MYYGTIKPRDIANGLGVRVSLFVSGCNNKCKGCFNKESWDFKYGTEFTKDTEDYIINELRNDFISGLSVLGGEPFDPRNQETLVLFLKRVKEYFPNKPIWCYSGYLFEDIKNTEMIKLIDILVDGPFIEEMKDISLKFRGSSNQRIIDINQSFKTNDVVLWSE